MEGRDGLVGYIKLSVRDIRVQQTSVAEMFVEKSLLARLVKKCLAYSFEGSQREPAIGPCRNKDESSSHP